MAQHGSSLPQRDDGRVIIHFDYDCFYAAVFEREDPKLRQLPFAVQQKQIIVTCNYEARRRGLHKLQLVKDARKKCPEVIISLGEDLTRFRNASKDNYTLLRKFAWGQKVEKLGFDEVFMDVTDMVDYNTDVLNRNALTSSFFHLDRHDPTIGFTFDASCISGHTFPATSTKSLNPIAAAPNPMPDELTLRLILGSHLAQHLRHQLEEQKSYTCTVGISTNKLLSKLVGNLNKPKGQTTLLPPYTACSTGSSDSNVTKFLDSHDIGNLPGIGFKIAQKIREHVLNRPATFNAGLVYGPTREQVPVRDVRLYSAMSAEVLERILAGPGTPKDLGEKVWGLINGIDHAEVAKAKDVPQQISIEDSYLKLDAMPEVKRELAMLASSLIKRMRIDLTAGEEEDSPFVTCDNYRRETVVNSRRWLAHPRTLRLTTRPRPPRNPDGSRPRMFSRISKSCPMPSIVFGLNYEIEVLAEKLVGDSLLPLFRQLHPEKSGWDLSLVNLCATNIAATGADNKDGAGRDIGRMFRRQHDVLKQWKVEDIDTAPSPLPSPEESPTEASAQAEQQQKPDLTTDVYWHENENPYRDREDSSTTEDAWSSEPETTDCGEVCVLCGASMPPFAMTAHKRFHALPD